MNFARRHLQAPEVSDKVQDILREGAQSDMPFEDGDAGIAFPSRWRLARLIEAAIKDSNK